MRAHVAQQLSCFRQSHSAGIIRPSVNDHNEQSRAIFADSHGCARVRARCEVVLHVRHFAVGEDLVRAGYTQVHVFRRPHFNFYVVAFGQLGDCFCPGFTANEHLRPVSHPAVAEAVDNAGGFRDSAVFDDNGGNLLRLFVWRPHRAVQGVVSPRRGVHTNAICSQPRGVHSGEVMLVAPWQCGCPGGCEFLDCRASLRDSQ